MVSVSEVSSHPKDCAAECYRDQENRDVISLYMSLYGAICRYISLYVHKLTGWFTSPNMIFHTRTWLLGCGNYVCLVAWLREFRRTVEIITRTLREVVTRVRLCGHTRG